MKSYLLALGLAALVPFSIVACGGDSAADVESSCNDIVKEAESCDKDTSSLSSECSSIGAQIEGTDCESEAVDYLDCFKDNICKDASEVDSTTCESESDKLSDCGDAFCKDHTTDSRCTQSAQSTARAKLFSIVRGNRY